MYILCTRCSLLTPGEPRGLEIGYSFRLYIASCVRRIKYTTRSWDGKMGGGQMNVILLARNRQFAAARIQQQFVGYIDWLDANQNLLQISVCQSKHVSKRPTKVPLFT